MTYKIIIEAVAEMACCRDGTEAYHPSQKPILIERTKNYLGMSITKYKKFVERKLYEKYRQIAEDECAGMGTLRICEFKFYIRNFQIIKIKTAM